MHSFMAKWSPALAISIAWRVIASPSPSMSSSQARVTLFRLPSGRPLLERLPTANGLPRLRGVSMEYLCGDELGAMAPDSAVSPTRPGVSGSRPTRFEINHHNPTLAGEGGRKEGRSQGVSGSFGEFDPLPQRRLARDNKPCIINCLQG